MTFFLQNSNMLKISDLELLHQSYLILNALVIKTDNQRHWIAAYANFRNELSESSLENPTDFIQRSVTNLLAQYSELSSKKIILTRFFCKEGDSILYQRTLDDELSSGVVSRVTDKGIVVGLFDDRVVFAYGDDFVALDKCVTVDFY